MARQSRNGPRQSFRELRRAGAGQPAASLPMSVAGTTVHSSGLCGSVRRNQPPQRFILELKLLISGTVQRMSEQEDAVADLSGAGVLAGIYWAGAAAYRQTMQDYNPRIGHKPGWVGYTAHQLLCDRMDRVFSCGDFQLPAGLPAEAGMDAVREGLHEEDFAAMPRIEPGLVSYSSLNSPPGWRFGSWRWLLQSFQFGESRKIRWATKSDTKRRVASYPDPDQTDLFTSVGLSLDGFESEPVVISETDDEDGAITLVLAHSVHRELRERELFMGRPNLASHQAWHWKHNLMTHPPERGGGLRIHDGPQPYTPNPNEVVSDAPVRLRQTPQERNSNETSG
jgi:hypothetical protein